MATRVLAGMIVAVVVVYHALRIAATNCSGGGCDWYIPFSLLLPVTALVLAGVTGAIGAYEARTRRGWSILLAACGVLGFVGPIVAAVVLKDNDTKVWLSTVLVLTVPVAVAVSALSKPSRIS